MSEPTIDPAAQKARIRAALDILQNYTDADGKLNATKLTSHIRDLEARLAEAERLLRLARDPVTVDTPACVVGIDLFLSTTGRTWSATSQSGRSTT